MSTLLERLERLDTPRIFTDLSIVPAHIIRDAAFNLGADELQDVDEYREKLSQMTPRDIFNCYCEWNGFVGYGDSLWRTVEALQVASINND